jgi:hypothetical protein
MATKMMGRERLARRMARLPAAVKAHIRDGLEDSAKLINGMQRRLAPVDDGDLIKTITWRWGNENRIAYAIGGAAAPMQIRLTAGGQVGGVDVRYAHIVEFGSAPHVVGGLYAGAMHPGTPPQPFFFGPYRANKRRVKSRMKRAFKRAVAASAGP